MTSKEIFSGQILEFVDISAEELEKFFNSFEKRKLKKSEFFIEENTYCKEIGFIVKGFFNSFILQEDGTEKTVCFNLEKGFLTSYESFMNDKRSDISIKALEDSEILVLKKKDYVHLISQNPKLEKLTLKILEQSLEEKLKYVSFLNEIKAKDKIKKFKTIQPNVYKRLTQEQIAAFLGITRRTVSQIINNEEF